MTEQQIEKKLAGSKTLSEREQIAMQIISTSDTATAKLVQKVMARTLDSRTRSTKRVGCYKHD